MLRSVDLPLPDGPIIEINSPFLTVKLMCFRATTFYAFEINILETFLTLRAIGSLFLFPISLRFMILSLLTSGTNLWRLTGQHHIIE